MIILLGMQTEVQKHCRETAISPTTINMWCATKNFSAQFPPVMCDCAMQTSLENRTVTNMSQQTSPSTDRANLLSTLPESFTDLKEILPKLMPPDLSPDRKTKTIIPRSKSADSARNKKSVAVGDSPTKCTFYTYKSLPDLSFLSGPTIIPNSNLSIFDPLPLDVPIPVFIKTEEYAKSQEILREKRSSQSQCKGQGHSGSSIKRSKSAPLRQYNSSLTKPSCGDSGSSSSGFSTSSTSSGIDQGYSEPRSSNNSPSNDIERLLFYPPHVEISSKSQTGSSKDSPTKDQEFSPIHTPPKCGNGGNPIHERAIPRYANEVYPGGPKVKVNSSPRSQSQTSSGVGSGCSSASSAQLDPHLTALQEEQTPVSSPERSASPHNCCHDNCSCYLAADLASIQDWRREQLLLRRKMDYQIQLSSESGSSSSSSNHPNASKKPLKSCLRKVRARSMTEPYTLMDQTEFKTKQAYKKNRHSYACEEVYLLRNENGEYFLCENKDETEEEESEENIDEKVEEEEIQISDDPPMFYLEDDSGNMDTVRRRQKKPVETKEEKQEEIDDDSSDKELSGKRKSVSFASEVSFHAISPAESPKRRDEIPLDDDEDENSGKECDEREQQRETTTPSQKDNLIKQGKQPTIKTQGTYLL